MLSCISWLCDFNPWNAEIYCISHGEHGEVVFLFEININVFVSSFCFIWIPMLCVYGHCKYLYSLSMVINLIPNLWRLLTKCKVPSCHKRFNTSAKCYNDVTETTKPQKNKGYGSTAILNICILYWYSTSDVYIEVRCWRLKTVSGPKGLREI